MGSTITCFFLEPADQGETFLRRYVYSKDSEEPCPSRFGYHHFEVSIGPQAWEPPREDLSGYEGEKPPEDDSRWPTTCPCGYVFQPGDKWQVNVRRLYRRSDTGELVTRDKAPVGAMWYADYYSPPYALGPDGHILVVKTPGGDWVIDCEKPWKRTGVPPMVTARPSILIGKDSGGKWTYHGFLTDGKLVEC